MKASSSNSTRAWREGGREREEREREREEREKYRKREREDRQTDIKKREFEHFKLNECKEKKRNDDAILN